jgi:nucleotide-binding universal stress UspA family protein
MVAKVVVPLDGSALAARALGPAQALAKRTGASLLLLSTRWDDAVDPAREYLQRQAAELGFERVDTMVIYDRVAGPAILTQVDEPDCVVCMSTHGRGGLGEAVLGSVAEEVLRRSTRPLLLVGPGLENGVWQSEHWFADGKLLVTVDGSEASEAIVPAAGEWARLLGLKPWVAHVVRGPADVVLELDSPEAGATVDRVARNLAEAGLAPQGKVIHGYDTAASILDFAERLPATLVAMATHGRSGFARVALGSVAMRVVHHSFCPVLVVRSPKPS